MLAFQKPEQIRQVIERGLESYTERTITDPAALETDLLHTRERGFAIDNMEHEYGISCIAVPAAARDAINADNSARRQNSADCDKAAEVAAD